MLLGRSSRGEFRVDDIVSGLLLDSLGDDVVVDDPHGSCDCSLFDNVGGAGLMDFVNQLEYSLTVF